MVVVDILCTSISTYKKEEDIIPEVGYRRFPRADTVLSVVRTKTYTYYIGTIYCTH